MKKVVTFFVAMAIAVPLWAALETTTYISGLVSSNPTGSDHYSTADDHIRLIKSSLLNTFPNITGAITTTQDEINKLDGMTASQAELNYVDGVTSALQTQLDAKLNLTRGQTVIDDDYTLVLTDRGKMIVNTNTAPAGVDILLPTFASVAMTAGSYVEVYNIDADSITITPDTGVSLNTNYGSSGVQTVPGGEGGLLIKISSNGWQFVRWLGDHTHDISEVDDITATTTELNYTDGVTSAIQTQLNAKAGFVGSFDTLRCGSTTIDFTSIAAGGRATTGISVASVAAGDPVFVGSSGLATGLVPLGYIASSGTINAGFANFTGSSVDPASVTLSVCAVTN